MNYIKDFLRLVFTSGASITLAVKTTNRVELVMGLTIVVFVLWGSLLFDQTDPRNHDRAKRLLEVKRNSHKAEQHMQIERDKNFQIINNEINRQLGKDHVTLDDLIAPNAKPAVNGIPPKDDELSGENELLAK